MHALIIEDDAMIAMIIEDTLREIGYTSFAFATSVDDAVAASEGRCPDMITADVRLAVGSGIEAVRRICSKKDIPAVYVTATAWEVLQQHADAIVVQKPFGASALCSAVIAARESGGGSSAGADNCRS